MNVRRALGRALPVAGTMAALAFLFHLAAPHWASVRASSQTMNAGWLLGGACALALQYLLGFAIWRRCLRAAGALLTARQAADTWVPSLVARYVPGKVWSHGVRVAVARRAGIALPAVSAAVGWEVLLALGVGSIVALVALQGTPVDSRIRSALMGLALTTFAVIMAAQLLARRARVRPWLTRAGLAQPLPAPTLIALAGAQGAAFALYGFAHWCLARAITPLGAGDLPMITGAVALAWMGGYLAFFTPAGLGVREGLLALLLAPALGAAPVVLLAALSRLASVVVEILLFAAWLAAHVRGAERQPKTEDIGQPPQSA